MRIAQGLLPYNLVEDTKGVATVTAHAGLPVVIEALRAFVPRRHYRPLARALGCSSRVVQRHMETLVALIAAGGENVSDVCIIRSDEGLSAALGFTPSSTTTLKEFLYRFHQTAEGQPLTPEQDAEASRAGQATIRPEGPAMRALAEFLRPLTRAVTALRSPGRATLDVDATIIEAHKKQALRTYEGSRGYQPQLAFWAEAQMWVYDEFRDGNVPAAYQVRAFLEKAFAAVPASVTQRRLRGDSALYDEVALSWADQRRIEFAVTADMSRELADAVGAVPETEWQPFPQGVKAKPDEEERQWADVVFVPNWARNAKKQGRAFRYVAVRVRSRQRDLLESDEERWKHFAVVTNLYDWHGGRLLQWHREKQGTVEHGHGDLKNELAAGTMPCGRFFANAAWLRINILVYNLFRALKLQALPESMSSMRPKALRFHLLNLPARITRHARALWVWLNPRIPAFGVLAEARRILAAYARGPTEAHSPT